MSHKPDPVVTNAWREFVIIGIAWFCATVYSCGYSYLYGYIRADRPLSAADVHPIFGMPSWFFWGVIAPWAACSIFIFWFAGFYMVDDDLGSDHTPELERDIREGGMHE